MASIIGIGVLKPYSQTLALPEPISTTSLLELMVLPDIYRENIIAVRDRKVLSLDELLSNDDEIQIFITAMGG